MERMKENERAEYFLATHTYLTRPSERVLNGNKVILGGVDAEVVANVCVQRPRGVSIGENSVYVSKGG